MPEIEPMMGEDIPMLSCIYADECEAAYDPEYCPCLDYKWREDEET